MKTYKKLFSSLIITSVVLFPNIVKAAQILELTGDVQIQRKNTEDFLPAHIGMTINLGDKIKLAEMAKIRVKCPGKKSKPLRPNNIYGLKKICLGQRNNDPRVGSIFLELLDGSYQYQTEMMNDQLLLILPSRKDANSYQVKITVGKHIMWEKEINNSQFMYDGGTFRPKVPYLLSVTTTNENSPFYQLRLNRVSSVVQETIQKEIDKSMAEDVNEEAKALMLFDVYVNHNQQLFLDAAHMLETIVKNESKNPIIHRLLGDMYVYLGKIKAAKIQYSQALYLAKSKDNIEEIAASQSGLASVAVINQELETAKSLLSQAEENYKRSGRLSDAELIQGYLSLINN